MRRCRKLSRHGDMAPVICATLITGGISTKHYTKKITRGFQYKVQADQHNNIFGDSRKLQNVFELG